jgi:translation elongation factor EF-4
MHTIGFMAASIRTLLPAMVVDITVSKKCPHRRSDLRGRKEWTSDVYEHLIPLKKVSFYLEMLIFSLLFIRA